MGRVACACAREGAGGAVSRRTLWLVGVGLSVSFTLSRVRRVVGRSGPVWGLLRDVVVSGSARPASSSRSSSSSSSAAPSSLPAALAHFRALRQAEGASPPWPCGRRPARSAPGRSMLSVGERPARPWVRGGGGGRGLRGLFMSRGLSWVWKGELLSGGEVEVEATGAKLIIFKY